jgi:hypothetical protein
VDTPYAATQQTSSDDYLEKLRDADIETKRIQRQFGSANGPAPVGISYESKRQGLNKFVSGDVDRRIAATNDANTLAKTIDNRVSNNNAQNQQLDTRNQFIDRDSINQQSNNLREQALQNAGTTANAKQQGQKIGFSAMKSRAERDDALVEAIQKGELKEQLLDAAQTHGIAMQDIDKMFQQIMNNMQNDWKDWEKSTQTDNDINIKKIEIRAANTAAIVNGVTGVANKAAQLYDKNSKNPSENIAQTNDEVYSDPPATSYNSYEDMVQTPNEQNPDIPAYPNIGATA